MLEIKNYINGEWCEASTGEKLERKNPANNDETVGRFAASKAEDVKKAIDTTGVAIQPSSVVLYYTGWSKKWASPWEYIRDYPGMDREAMEYLADRGVICVGADAPSIDSYAEVKTVRVQPAHIVCREREILNIENLGRVDLVPKHEYFFVGLPLKIKGASGSPIRAIAITEK